MMGITGSWPFARWGIDLVGPFPTATVAETVIEWTVDYVANRKAFGKTIGKIGYPCIASIQGSAGKKGWGVGNSPMYQRFLIDYVRFRSANTQGADR
jgi:hypothetical protein